MLTSRAIVYTQYAKDNNLGAVAIYLFALVAAQCVSVGEFLSFSPSLFVPLRETYI